MMMLKPVLQGAYNDAYKMALSDAKNIDFSAQVAEIADVFDCNESQALQYSHELHAIGQAVHTLASIVENWCKTREEKIKLHGDLEYIRDIDPEYVRVNNDAYSIITGESNPDIQDMRVLDLKGETALMKKISLAMINKITPSWIQGDARKAVLDSADAELHRYYSAMA